MKLAKGIRTMSQQRKKRYQWKTVCEAIVVSGRPISIHLAPIPHSDQMRVEVTERVDTHENGVDNCHDRDNDACEKQAP